MALSSLESEDRIGPNSLMAASIGDGLGPFGLFSTVRWPCIGRVNLEAPIPIPSSESDAVDGATLPICHEKILARAGRTLGHQHKMLSLLIDS